MHIYNGKYKYLFDKYHVSYNISYELLLSMNVQKYKNIYKGMLDSLYSYKFVFYPLDLSYRLLYLFILDECDINIFKKDVDEFINFLNTNELSIIANVPYHIDMLYKIDPDKYERFSTDFQNVLLDLFINVQCEYFFKYVNELLKYNCINENINKLLVACFNKLNDDYNKEYLTVINDLLKYNTNFKASGLNDTTCDKIYKDVRFSSCWNNLSQMQYVSKYSLNKYQAEIDERLITLEAEASLKQLCGE